MLLEVHWSTFGDLAKEEDPQIYRLGDLFVTIMSGAEGQSRTDMGLPPTVFETVASTIPPLRHAITSIIPIIRSEDVIIT